MTTTTSNLNSLQNYYSKLTRKQNILLAEEIVRKNWGSFNTQNELKEILVNEDLFFAGSQLTNKDIDNLIDYSENLSDEELEDLGWA